MPLEDIIQQILSSRPDLTREEVLKMVEKKEKNAKGFLTRESAARTLAIELGVETSKVSFKHGISIEDLISGLSDVTIVGRVLFVYPPQKFVRSDGTEGMVRRLLVADKTGEIMIVLWDDKAKFPNIEEAIDRTVKFSHGYVRQGFDGKLELNMGSRGKIEISPPDISEGEYPALARFIKKINEITVKEESVNVLGIVEHIYPAAIFKRQDGGEGKVRRLELKDDGGKITIVLWNNRVDELADIENGKYLEIFKAKVKERPDGCFELHADNSTSISVLTKKPSYFETLSARLVKIKNLKPNMNGIRVLGRIMHKGEVRKFSTQRGNTGYVSTLLMSDETGSVRLNLWEDKAHLSERFQIGDIALIEGAYTRQKFDKISLNLDAKGSLTLNPIDIEGAVLPPCEEKIIKISDLKNESDVVTVEGTVVTLPVIREVQTSRNEKVKIASFELADETEKIEVCLWRELAAQAENLSVNDQIRIRHVYVNRDFSGRLRLSSSTLTSISKL